MKKKFYIKPYTVVAMIDGKEAIMEFDINDNGEVHTVLMYARDDEGFKNLMALSSFLCVEKKEALELKDLNKYTDHNILCLLSDDMPLTIAVDRNEDLNKAYALQKEKYGDHIIGLMDHDKAINVNRDAILRAFLKSQKATMIALNRTFYLNRDDYEEYDVLKCIRDKKIITDKDVISESGRYFLSPDEYDLLYEKGELLNTDILASKCNVDLAYQTSLPAYENKKGIPSKDYLISLCREGLKRRLKGKVSEAYRKRLDYELSVIVKMNFEDYFLHLKVIAHSFI